MIFKLFLPSQTTTKTLLQDLSSTLLSPILRKLIGLQLQKKKMVHAQYASKISTMEHVYALLLDQWLRTNISCLICKENYL